MTVADERRTQPTAAKSSETVLTQQQDGPSKTRQSFAEMKKTREAKPSSVSPQTTSQTKSGPSTAPPSNTLTSVRPAKPLAPSIDSSTSQPPRQFEPPLDPTSTAPGSGIALLRYLAPPSLGWDALQHYPPGNVPIILGPLLEPDSLANLLAALHHGVNTVHSDEEDGATRERVRAVMMGMKGMPRWKVNAAMLSKSEREMGREIWEECGGEGAWP